MRILYFGNSSPFTTSGHRIGALQRLGHSVFACDPYIQSFWNKLGPLRSRYQYHTGYRFLQKGVIEWCRLLLVDHKLIDLIWVDSGELFGLEAINALRKFGSPLVLFNHDDPTGPRDAWRFFSLRRALGLYDVVTAVREESEHELKQYGCRKVVRIWRSYDEVAHNPVAAKMPISEKFISDICFIGTQIPHEQRDHLVFELVKSNLNVAIWGERWNRSSHWPKIRHCWRGPGVYGEDYVRAIAGAKINLGLLSKGNRDLHTTRSMEIPFAGGLLCAERTSEHKQLYVEGVEAEFWSSFDECVQKCEDLLDDPVRREQIRTAGMIRVRKNRVGNEDICKQILSAA